MCVLAEGGKGQKTSARLCAGAEWGVKEERDGLPSLWPDAAVMNGSS